MSKTNPRWKIRRINHPEYATMTESEPVWGNGCEHYGCRIIGDLNGRCFDGVVRELCFSHYAMRNLVNPNKGPKIKFT